MTTQLSKNFTLEELCESATARKNGFTEQFNPPLEIQSNLRKLCENILQPLRDKYGKPIHSSCGYRCKRLNTAVKGKDSSQHLHGNADDIDNGPKENEILFNLIIDLKLPFDQLIAEGGKDKNGKPKFLWIHVSYDETRNRRQILYL